MKLSNAIHIGMCGALLFGAVQWGTAATVFFDDFNGSQLSGDWTVLRETPSRYSVGGGVLDLQTTPGDVYGSVNTHKNMLLIPAPVTGDFRVTVRLESFAPVAQNFTQFNILAFDDQDNLVRCIYGHISGARQLQFGAEVGTSWSGVSSAKDFGSGAFFLRLEKIGNVYTQTYSLDGVNFLQALGSVTYGDGTPQSIGIWAGVDATESSHALVDWIKVEDNSDCAFLPVGAVAWWRGENAARDSLGGHDATAVNGATHADGHSGRGFYFSAAANAAFQIPAPAALESPSEITIEAWVRPRSFPNAAPSVVRKNKDATTVPQFLLAVGDGSNPGRPHFNPGVDGASATGSTEIPLNAWTHLAGTYDGTTATLYVDGQVVATKAVAGTIPTSTRDLFIGNE